MWKVSRECERVFFATNQNRRAGNEAAAVFVNFLNANNFFAAGQNVLPNQANFNYAFNEQLMNEIATAYPAETRNVAISTIKFLMVAGMSSLPNDSRPTDRLIEDYIALDRILPAEINNFALVVRSQLLATRDLLQEAINCLERIPVESDLHARVQGRIARLREQLAARVPR